MDELTGLSFRLILPINSTYSIDESPSEADMARWMVGSGPDELLNPQVEENGDPPERSGTPLPSRPQQIYDDLYT